MIGGLLNAAAHAGEIKATPEPDAAAAGPAGNGRDSPIEGSPPGSRPGSPPRDSTSPG